MERGVDIEEENLTENEIEYVTDISKWIGYVPSKDDAILDLNNFDFQSIIDESKQMKNKDKKKHFLRMKRRQIIASSYYREDMTVPPICLICSNPDQDFTKYTGSLTWLTSFPRFFAFHEFCMLIVPECFCGDTSTQLEKHFLNLSMVSLMQGFKRAVLNKMNLDCAYCGLKGAMSGCFVKRCGNAYHLPCAIRSRCYISYKDDEHRLICRSHRDILKSWQGKVIKDIFGNFSTIRKNDHKILEGSPATLRCVYCKSTIKWGKDPLWLGKYILVKCDDKVLSYHYECMQDYVKGCCYDARCEHCHNLNRNTRFHQQLGQQGIYINDSEDEDSGEEDVPTTIEAIEYLSSCDEFILFNGTTYERMKRNEIINRLPHRKIRAVHENVSMNNDSSDSDLELNSSRLPLGDVIDAVVQTENTGRSSKTTDRQEQTVASANRIEEKNEDENERMDSLNVSKCCVNASPSPGNAKRNILLFSSAKEAHTPMFSQNGKSQDSCKSSEPPIRSRGRPRKSDTINNASVRQRKSDPSQPKISDVLLRANSKANVSAISNPEQSLEESMEWGAMEVSGVDPLEHIENPPEMEVDTDLADVVNVDQLSNDQCVVAESTSMVEVRESKNTKPMIAEDVVHVESIVEENMLVEMSEAEKSPCELKPTSLGDNPEGSEETPDIIEEISTTAVQIEVSTTMLDDTIVSRNPLKRKAGRSSLNEAGMPGSDGDSEVEEYEDAAEADDKKPKRTKQFGSNRYPFVKDGSVFDTKENACPSSFLPLEASTPSINKGYKRVLRLTKLIRKCERICLKDIREHIGPELAEISKFFEKLRQKFVYMLQFRNLNRELKASFCRDQLSISVHTTFVSSEAAQNLKYKLIRNFAKMEEICRALKFEHVDMEELKIADEAFRGLEDAFIVLAEG